MRVICQLELMAFVEAVNIQMTRTACVETDDVVSSGHERVGG